MSLLNQASPFTTENSLSTNGKKFVPKMMDTFKRITSEQTMNENMTTEKNEQEKRKNKIDELIKNMSDTNTESEGLADYHSNDKTMAPSPAPTKTQGSSFSKSYVPTPYYQGLSSSSPTSSSTSSRKTLDSELVPSNQLLEKLNYMIHLLEEQQKESTQNITEEFALYSLLGIFIIYIVDSFTRAGKYTR